MLDITCFNITESLYLPVYHNLNYLMVSIHKHGEIKVPVLLGLDAGVVRVPQLIAEPELRASVPSCDG